jgi:DNA-binding PadR family transcriptional regulator
MGTVPPGPLCPVVLSLLAARPLAIHEVASELGRRALARPGDYPAARAAIERLRAAGLARAAGPRPVYRLTARGRRELALQRLVWARLAAAAAARRPVMTA